MAARGVSIRREQTVLVESLHAAGRSRVEIATVVGQRFRVNPRVAFRLAHGWTQQQTAEAWNERWPDDPKTFKAVSRWEVWPAPSGHAPPFEVLSRLAELYQCRVSDLVADQADYRHLDPATRAESLSVRARVSGTVLRRSESGGQVVAVPVGYGGPDGPVSVPLGSDVHAALAPLGHGVRQVMPVPGGTYFAGTEIEVDVFPAVDDDAILAQVPDGYPSGTFLTRSRRGLVVGAVPTNASPAHYGVDTRWAHRRLSGAGRGARLGIPAAYRLDEVTLGLLWALSNLDDALLHDDRLIAEQRPALERFGGMNRSSAGRAAVDELNAVSAMWLGSDFCARHILRHVDATNWPAAFWTREQRGEECSAWLFFGHKLAYLERLAQRGPRAEVTRTFCVPEAAVVESQPGERVLVFLAMALMESFGVRTRLVAAPEYQGLDGFALAGNRRAIVANWVGCDGVWLVDVTEQRPKVSAYADALSYAAAHGLTSAPTPRQRLQMVADYLGLGWAAMAQRCAELAEYGLTGLIDPRSRLLSIAGAERACRYVAELESRAGRPGHRRDEQGGAMSENQRRVVVFGLGGTIAMSESAAGGVTPSLSAQELVSAVSGLAATGTSIDVVEFRRLPGASLDFATLTDLAAAVSDAVEQGAAGTVVTQGTDTIEETSFLLDLYHRRDAPLVVTGAMRSPAMAGADGPANLLAAVVAAADSSARGRGVLVVLNDEIHAARRVRKTNTTSVGTFQSPGSGPLGHVIEGAARWAGPRQPRLIVPPPQPARDPKVALHTVVLDDDPALLSALSGHVDGLVVAAMGAGHVPDRLVEPLSKAATTIPVVLASRTGSGSVLRHTYGFPGSERDLIEHRLIPAGLLDPLKARILLRCLLACGADRSEILTAFAVAGQYTDSSDWPWPIEGGPAEHA